MRSKFLIPLFILTLLPSGCYGEITSTVVDSETGKPIEGAVVLVEWTITKGLPGMSYTESYKVIETITDENGRFTISEWVYNPLVNKPTLTVYKKGYVAWNSEFIFPNYERRKDFKYKEGVIIKLEQFKVGYSYDAHVSFIETAINLTLAYEKKKKMREAFNWEVDLARKEIKERK